MFPGEKKQREKEKKTWRERGRLSNPFAQEDDREDVLIYYLVVILIGLFVVKIKNDKSMERDKYNID